MEINKNTNISKKLKTFETNFEEYPDRIAETFKGKTVLISGASGFIGKVLLEKLLRCCSEVRKIYVIIRPKYGLTVQERMERIYQSPLFDKLKSRQGFSLFSKIQPLSGDVSAENLGLSPQSIELLRNEVEIVYHAAANCRFDETLKTAVLINVRGTKLMLELAKKMPNLLLFIHISTAYCHLHERIVYEIPYNPPEDPEKILKIVEGLRDEDLGVFLHKILDDIPNTYTFTKALAEGIVNKELGNMPLVLLRPSFVIPIWKDPVPGWTDTINGIIGFEIASGKGILRTIHTDENHYADFLPADVAVAAFLFTAFEYLTFQKDIPIEKRHNIHNITTSSEYKVTWKDMKYIGKRVINERVPLNWVVWYPDTIMTTNYYLYSILAFLWHLLPALLIDPILIFLGYGSVLLKAHKRLLKGFDMMDYYSKNQWDFHNEWSLQTREIMNPRERKNYILFGDGIDYIDYFSDCVLSARRHILHESDESIPTARKHLKMMYFVDLATKIFLGYFLCSRIINLIKYYF